MYEIFTCFVMYIVYTSDSVLFLNTSVADGFVYLDCRFSVL